MENKDTPSAEAKNKIKQGGGTLMSGLKEFFDDWIDLRDDLDREGTITNIYNNKRMRGANAWLLMCSIMVASLGLNLNSPAVIIGAMLISPLMSPILGIGLSVGINDRNGLFVAFKHFGVSIAIALVTSFTYFALTPIDEFTNEIAARTEPTFLDVLVAVFGGLAGIISATRMDKSNAIPGVAIATALMPPLCVTGYGLANAEWTIAFNSFYLFFMNSTFIALTTYFIVVFLRFPKKKYETRKERVRTRRILAAVAIVILIPSISIFLNVLEQVQDRQRITQFVEKTFPDGILRIENPTGSDTLKVRVFLLEDVSEEELATYQNEFQALDCKAVLSITDAQRTGITKAEFEKTTTTLQNEYLNRVEAEKMTITTKKDREISRLHHQLDSLRADTVIFRAAAKELRVLFPELEEIRYAKMQTAGQTYVMPTFLLKWSDRKKQKDRQNDERRIEDFLRIREGLDTLQIVRF